MQFAIVAAMKNEPVKFSELKSMLAPGGDAENDG
jgi:hypothetical protein